MSTLDDPYEVPVTFVNEVPVIGFCNGVVNVTLSVARFSPQNMETSQDIEPDSIVASRLRMDLMCAISLRDALSKIIEQNTKGPARPGPKMDS